MYMSYMKSCTALWWQVVEHENIWSDVRSWSLPDLCYRQPLKWQSTADFAQNFDRKYPTLSNPQKNALVCRRVGGRGAGGGGSISWRITVAKFEADCWLEKCWANSVGQSDDSLIQQSLHNSFFSELRKIDLSLTLWQRERMYLGRLQKMPLCRLWRTLEDYEGSHDLWQRLQKDYWNRWSYS